MPPSRTRRLRTLGGLVSGYSAGGNTLVLSSLVSPFAHAAAEAIKRAVHKAPTPAAQRSVRFCGIVVVRVVKASSMSRRNRYALRVEVRDGARDQPSRTPDRAMSSSYHPCVSALRLWSIGLVLGVAATLVLPYSFSYYGVPLVIAIGLAVTAAVLRPRPAGAAGYLTAVGALWLLTLQRTTEQCAELNRQPNASCQMGDNSLLILVGLLLLGAALALTALLFVSRTPSIPSRTPV